MKRARRPHTGRRHTSRHPGKPERLRLRLRQRSQQANTEDNLNAALPVRAPRNLAALQTSRRGDLGDAGLNKPERLRLRLRQHSQQANTEDNLNAALPVRVRSNLAALQTSRREDLEDAGLNKPERCLLPQRARLLTRAPGVEDSEGRVPMVSAAELPLGGLLLAARLVTKNHKAGKRKARKRLLLLALNNTNLI